MMFRMMCVSRNGAANSNLTMINGENSPLFAKLLIRNLFQHYVI